MGGEYFNYACDYGRNKIENWATASELALRDFQLSHKDDKNWKADFYATLIVAGVGVVVAPLIPGVVGALVSAELAAAIGPGIMKQGMEMIQKHVTNKLNEYLVNNSEPVAFVMFEQIQAGLSKARDHYADHMNEILNPIRSRCEQLAASGPRTTKQEDEVELFVTELLPCGRQTTEEIRRRVRLDLETIWNEYVQSQRSQDMILMDFVKFIDPNTPAASKSFVPSGRWDYSIFFYGIGACNKASVIDSSGRTGIGRREKLLLWEVGNYKVNYKYVVTFKAAMSGLTLVKPFNDGCFFSSTNDPRQVNSTYNSQVKSDIKARWRRLMPQARCLECN